MQMDKLRQYLNKLTPKEQEKFAKKCGTTIGYMRKVICLEGKCFFGPIIARKIETNTNGKVTRKLMRPHDWKEYWPELSKRKAKVA